jgi:hypothetical protein
MMVALFPKSLSTSKHSDIIFASDKPLSYDCMINSIIVGHFPELHSPAVSITTKTKIRCGYKYIAVSELSFSVYCLLFIAEIT